MKKWNLLLLLGLALVLTIVTPVQASIDLSEEISAEDEFQLESKKIKVIPVWKWLSKNL